MIAETLWLRCEAATLFIPQLDGGSVALIDSKEDQTSPPACMMQKTVSVFYNERCMQKTYIYIYIYIYVEVPIKYTMQKTNNGI
jgi:hypothetical protein